MAIAAANNYNYYSDKPRCMAGPAYSLSDKAPINISDASAAPRGTPPAMRTRRPQDPTTPATTHLYLFILF